ncbi:MAG: hypothetical protein HOQ09_00525, partial [Gemmatimonadaceae bacterium]|nr:hypothetical protein [Gemmatimonadaceae bacterium]
MNRFPILAACVLATLAAPRHAAAQGVPADSTARRDSLRAHQLDPVV